jgi:uncharacterized membrane protein YdjX (TVP38/TMEM64 family)
VAVDPQVEVGSAGSRAAAHAAPGRRERRGAGTVARVMLRRAGIGLLLVALAAVAVFLLRDGVPGIPELRATVAASGVWGPVVFVVLHGVLCAAPLPRSAFTVAAGVLFGTVTGIATALIGTALAAGLSFVLARFVGGRFVERHAHRAPVAWVRSRIEHRGLLAMISLRLIPIMPFSVMNYGAALAGAKLGPFLLGTVLGVLPGTLSLVILGDAAVSGNPDPVMLVVSFCSGAVGFIGALVVARRPPAPAPVAATGDGPDAPDLERAA